MTNPEHHHPLAAKQGRCGLADACMALDDCEKANHLLRNVVQCDPDDTCDLAALSYPQSCSPRQVSGCLEHFEFSKPPTTNTSEFLAKHRSKRKKL